MATKINAQAVLTINGKQVEETITNLKRNVTILRQDLNKLTVGTDDWNKKLAELKQGEKRLSEVRQEIGYTKKEAVSFTDTISSSNNKLKEMFSNLLAGQISFRNLGGTIKLFAVESWAAISSIPLIGWVAAIVGAVGLGMKEVMDYNNAIAGNIKKLDNLGVDQKVRPQIEAISEYFKVGFDEISNAVDQMLDLGIVKDAAEAVEEIKRGLIKAPDKSAFLSTIEQTAETAKKLGMNLSNIIIIKEEIENRGLDGEKAFGSMNTVVNRLLGNAEKIKPLLENTFGAQFANSLFQGITNGTLKYGEALNLIYKKGEEIGISDKERADIAKNLFGKSSASAYDYNNTLQLISESYRDNYDDLSKIQEKTANQVSLYEQLAIEKDKALNSSSLRAFQRDLKEFWLQAQINFFKFINWLEKVDNATQYSAGFIRGMFLAIPETAKAAFNQTIKAFDTFISTLQSGGKSVWYFLTGDTEKANAEFTKFKNNANSFAQDLKNIKNISIATSVNAGMKEGTKQLNEYNAAKKKKADLERAEEATEKRNSRASNFGASKNDGKPKKETENRRKEAEKNKQDLEKELNDSQDSYEKANDDILAAENKLADEKLKIQSESINKEIAQQNQFHKEELEKLEQNNQKILDKILELEKKKLEAKNPLAKVNYQNAIDQEKKLLEINNSIKEQTEHTHQFKIKTIREKATAKKFEDDAKFTQRQIENRRRDREQEITNISSLEQAKEKLRNQSYLKLTDDELSAIDNLEDAKSALREVYDREMLANQEKAISLQIAQLNKALNNPSLSEEARQKLAENLDFLKDKITQVRAAIKGGEEADAKKVTEENKQKKRSIDILGFSAQDWEETFNNLNTTAKKVKAIGMVFTAMSNAASMFSELQRNIGERDLQRFEKQQSAKKKALLKNLNLGLINQEEYQKSIQKIEAETANKKAEIEYKQAKADKIARMFAIIGNTAAGIAAALPNIPLSIIVGALGAVQLGIVAAQPLPEKQSYATGGFTGSGFGSADSTGLKPAGIVHQNEWVAPPWMLQQPRTAKVIDYLESIRQGKTTPMAEGGYSDSNFVNKSQDISTNADTSNADYVQFISALMQVKDLLQKLYDEGITAEMTDSEQNGKLFKKAIKKFETIENRASGK